MPAALLISTYEMGRQPFGLASSAAWLSAAGWTVTCADLSRQMLPDAAVTSADLIGFYLPMHTATRLAAPVMTRVRTMAPRARLVAFGLYAPLNRDWLESLGVSDVLGGEFEQDLVSVARGLAPERSSIARLAFLVPDRQGLPPLDRYATLVGPDGRRQRTGYTEASRGCRHLCRHCPVVPVYGGQFRVVQADVVLADIANQVAAGAEHITFGDPDFFNGPTHAVRIVEALHAAHPSLTYDVTIKVEHLLQQEDLLPRLRDTGCVFITTAVESVDDAVLARLEKGHTRRDFVDAVALCRRVGVTVVPTFVAFHPWTTLAGYCDLLDTIEALNLVDHVAPIQLAIRLLIPQASRLLELPDVRLRAGRFDPATLTHRWTHEDPRVDALQQDVSDLVGVKLVADRRTVFDEISRLAHDRASIPHVHPSPARDRATVPYLNEPWYC